MLLAAIACGAFVVVSAHRKRLRLTNDIHIKNQPSRRAAVWLTFRHIRQWGYPTARFFIYRVYTVTTQNQATDPFNDIVDYSQKEDRP